MSAFIDACIDWLEYDILKDILEHHGIPVENSSSEKDLKKILKEKILDEKIEFNNILRW